MEKIRDNGVRFILFIFFSKAKNSRKRMQKKERDLKVYVNLFHFDIMSAIFKYNMNINVIRVVFLSFESRHQNQFNFL